MKKSNCSILLACCISILLVSCGKLREPEFRGLENIRVSKLGAQQTLLGLDLVYHNPNKARLKLKEAEGDAWLDGNLLGHFRIDTLIDIAPLSDFRLPVTLELDMQQVFRNTLNLVLNPEINVKVDGRAKVGKGGLFIRYPLKYEGKHNLGAMLLKQ